MHFFQQRVSSLGHIISASRLEVDRERERESAVEIVKEPSSGFIPGFEKTAEPLYSLLNKSNKFERSTECKMR